MKKTVIAACLLMSIAFVSNAQALKTPAPSTTQTIKQEFGLGTIELSYSRPSAKGRVVMGDLVPYGKVWRTGANSATTLTFSDDVTIGGKLLKAGKYGLLSIPDAKEWTLIITKDLNITSPSAYNEANDVVRVKSAVTSTGMKVETFTMQFANVANSTIDLVLRWENAMVALPITTDVDGKVMNQINNAMNVDSRPYYAAAQYYYDNGKDLKQAKTWVDKAIAANPNAFWMTLLCARICNKSGDKAGAKTMAQKTIELATTAKNDDYIKMANDLLKTL
ncbi:MAG TPA: DUF2911 domain-containing protein [Phnomibacter sp.]|nr:DUF2911 domain-containing protein [Phnomibacter sp.]